jgi:NTP pyrophosphatase (non-canonical NTP hydrolase)
MATVPEPLLPDATLADVQTYVSQLEVERGFNDESVMQKCLLLGEEVGELFKAVRKTHAGITTRASMTPTRRGSS